MALAWPAWTSAPPSPRAHSQCGSRGHGAAPGGLPLSEESPALTVAPDLCSGHSWHRHGPPPGQLRTLRVSTSVPSMPPSLASLHSRPYGISLSVYYPQWRDRRASHAAGVRCWPQGRALSAWRAAQNPWSMAHPALLQAGAGSRWVGHSGTGRGWWKVTGQRGGALNSVLSQPSRAGSPGENAACPFPPVPPPHHSALLPRPPLQYHHPPVHPLPCRHLPARVWPEPLHHLSWQHQHRLRRLHQRHTLQK